MVVKSTLPIIPHLREKVWRYSLNDTTSDLYAAKYEITLNGSIVTLSNGIQFTLQYPGIHNIENAVAAVSVALQLGIDPEKISSALNNFKGIYRRFEKIYSDNNTVYIDDYAHHPEEIRMFLMSVREIYKGKKITAIFQPHLFTRTRDLADGFAASLDLADEVILLPIYPAREEPIEGVTADTILSRVTNSNKQILSKEALLEKIKQSNFDVICTIGAGDIDKLVQPIAEILKSKA
jgi:UDP-N-acetylmuramate--alanine ligase